MILLSFVLPLLGLTLWGMTMNYYYRWVGNDPSKSIVFGFLCLDWLITVGTHAPSIFFLASSPARFGLLWFVVVLLLIAVVLVECAYRMGCVAFQETLECGKANILCPDFERKYSPIFTFVTFCTCWLSLLAYIGLPIVGLFIGSLLTVYFRN